MRRLVDVQLLIPLLIAAVTVGCPGAPAEDAAAYEGVMSFDTASVRIVKPSDTLHVRVELAKSSEQRTMGLMERRQLAEDAGMLFVYDSTQPATAGFWMYRTRIPLDIAYVDSAGVIRAALAMVPCPTTIPEGCKTYEPGVPYQYALEVNAGYFARHGVEVGHTVLLPGALAARGTK